MPGKFKIAIVAQFPLDVLDAEMGGRAAGHAATWLPQLARAFECQTEFDIHWFALAHKSRSAVSRRKWGQAFHAVPCPRASVCLLLGRWPVRTALGRLFRSEKPDLVHVFGTENLNGSALCAGSGLSILSMQGVIHTIFKTGDIGGLWWLLYRHWESTSLRRASVVTGESAWALARVGEVVGDKKMRRIEYGVYPSFYDEEWRPDGTRAEVLFAGRLSRSKGVDILLEMLRRHPERNWRVVFAGSGPLERPLKDLNDPLVEVLGTIGTRQVQERMARSWALVHPSRADSSPNVVKEARVIGLPVVGSPHGGHAEYIVDGIDGFVVDSDDPDVWFEVLDRLCQDYVVCRKMGASRHAYYREHFRPENTARAFLELYRELFSGR